MKNPLFLRLTASAGVLATLVASGLAVRSPVAAALRAGEPVSGVLIGTDWVELARHSDTLMLWVYDPRLARTDVLSIPRDTRINLPGYRFRRINEVFAYHFGLKRDHDLAAREVAAAVGSLLAFGGDPAAAAPRHYVHVDYDGFRRLIDLLGGVDVRVDEPLHYDDTAGNLHIHLDPGDHHLDGADALGYVRFRGRSGDRGRILRQMEFLRNVSGRLNFPLLALRWPRLLTTVYSSIHTSFGFGDFVFLALEAKHVRSDRVNPWLLPGQPKGAYWEMDEARAALVLRQMRGAAAPAPALSASSLATVKVWNGSGRAGLALAVTRRLRAAGFDVLEWGNYNLRQTKTRVVDRTGDIGRAHAVAGALGAGSVFSDVNPKLGTDVEVILGEDILVKQ